MLIGVQIQHELCDSTVQTSKLTFHHHKTRTRDLGCACEIQTVAHFTQIHMIFHFKIIRFWGAPTRHFYVFAVVFTVWHCIVWNVRHGLGDRIQLRHNRIQFHFFRIQIVTQGADLLLNRFCARFVARRHQLTDLLGDGVTRGL
ncbi:Uncharacterised protein [Vibrio cholerae]|nr:Uncharacterised protein [Vibrio cholerae]CSA58357.1 Uncharacterised protein [Vibrio cholerae]CSB09008.1 Uncharacterised protein [Vibrio cholerae]